MALAYWLRGAVSVWNVAPALPVGPKSGALSVVAGRQSEGGAPLDWPHSLAYSNVNKGHNGQEASKSLLKPAVATAG